MTRTAGNPTTIATPLQQLLDDFRDTAVTPREWGNAFELLCVAFFTREPRYAELYATVETWADWAARQGRDRRDVGIDLVAETRSGEVHAIQCKHYAPDYRIQKPDIDSFFTASGKRPFAHRIIVTTTDLWSAHAEDALRDQQIPVSVIDLTALEESAIDWASFRPGEPARLKPRKTLRPHQLEAVSLVAGGLEDHDRGKMIMACGTGKTFTSLKLAERVAGAGGRVLFLVPSLALLSQTLTEWTQESATPLRSFAVCSDSDVGKQTRNEDDAVRTLLHELAYPATTDAARLAAKVRQEETSGHMTVVFSTYHSIAVVHEAQQLGLPAFDLIICDEAHRTTGASFDGEDESAFVRVHDNAYIRGRKRVYMTATPRIFGDAAQEMAQRDNVALYSMDDPSLYGPTLYVLTFSEAVRRDLLVDYKVVVLAIEETHVSRRVQELLRDDNNTLRVDDAAKIVGCWKALAKQGLEEELAGDASPMQRAVAFCQVIRENPRAKQRKVASVNIAEMFQGVVEAYQQSDPDPPRGAPLRCEARHVDGTMNASTKEGLIRWLKDDAGADACRILSNVRCLSEGVDVPALDAVLFLTARNSQVDVVQSVGRVMRKAPGKRRGYVVLPVVIPAGVEPHAALDDNRTYKVVWQVLNALRSHDDRFDAMINKLDLTGPDRAKMEVIAVTDRVVRRSAAASGGDRKRAAAKKARGASTIGRGQATSEPDAQTTLPLEIGEIERAIYARIVQKVGNRHHWEDWAKDIAAIARTHIDRLNAILEDPANTRERAAFDAFADELRDDLNDSIQDEEVVEMLAQHLVTRPVFDALFAGHSFVSQNALSRAMQAVLDTLDTHRIDKEARTLEAFYESVQVRAAGIDSAEGRQKIIVELYDRFFRNAFPRMSERLGIVYTPVEIVDFILHSVDDLLRSEFGQSLSSEGVHVLDPFTGTGTFITRLLQSGLIEPQDLPRKYTSELHANELVLLAYYIAAINIEATFDSLTDGEYRPFEGICLTDTFQMYEKDDLVAQMLVDNSARRTRQKQLDIRVIIGNPPYSVGQTSANDNNRNVAYPHLDERIRATYGARSAATSSKPLYDSYIRAIRWASDRVGDRGVIGFVTNGGFLDASTADGLRRCLQEEFSSVHVFHLRGNQRTSGERSRREGGKVFGSGSRAPVAITLLVKDRDAAHHGSIRFRDVGDYLTREQKLDELRRYRSVAGVSAENGWTMIEPDEHGDWLSQRDDSFSEFLAFGSKTSDEPVLFETYSLGVATARDAWAYNPSRTALAASMSRMIDVYNDERRRFHATPRADAMAARLAAVDRTVDADPTRISWTRALKQSLARDKGVRFDPTTIVRSLYRPFSPQWLCFDRDLNDMVYLMPRLFPSTGGGDA